MAKKDDGAGRPWLRALAHPLRVRILEFLEERPASPVQMADAFNERLGTVSYHCRVLLECEFIELLETRPARGAIEHIYRTTPDSEIGSRSWQEVPPSLRGDVAAAAVDDLTTRAIAALKAGTFRSREGSAISWSPMTVDEEGWRELVKLVEDVEERFHLVAKNCAERFRTPTEGIPVVVAIAAFEAGTDRRRQGR